MSDNLKILSKMAAIMADVDIIEKDATNLHGKYKYASEFAIKLALHKALVDHKVVFQMNVQPPTMIAGVTSTQYLPVEYIFWDVESGESVSGNFTGSAHIRDEKGHYAAITGAIKYILTSTFLIPTGDDPEANENDKKKKQDNTMPVGDVSSKQITYVKQLMDARVVPDELSADICTWVAGTGQTQEQASAFLDRLKECPAKVTREQLIARCAKGEPKVYPLKAAILSARIKYLGCETLEEATDDKLASYLNHMLEKVAAAKAKKEVAE